jgi:hypothetical protein
MPLPVVGEQDPNEVRMPVEPDAEEVPRLALVPVRRGNSGVSEGTVGSSPETPTLIRSRWACSTDRSS